MLATLRINIQIRLAVNQRGPLELLGIECERMPWLGTEEDIRSTVLEICKVKPNDPVNLGNIQDRIFERLGEILEREEISIHPAIELTLVAQEPGALNRIQDKAARLCRLVDYEKYVLHRSRKFLQSDLDVPNQPASLKFHPDSSRQNLTVCTFLRNPIWLESVSLFADDWRVAQRHVGQLIEPGLFEIQSPMVNVRDYQRLHQAGDCSLQLYIGKEGAETGLKVTCDPNKFVSGPLSIFMDMGSTRAKLITMAMSEWTNDSTNQLRNWIERLDHDELTEDVSTAIQSCDPVRTTAFLERFGLPQIEKRKLATMSDADLARWLGEAVHRFAIYYANQSKSRAIAEVVWSFPRTKGSKRDFEAITKEANSIAFKSILGCVHVVEEHEALHHRFKGVLQSLAKSSTKVVSLRDVQLENNAEKSQQESLAREKHTSDWNTYNQRGFFGRLFNSTPTEPDWTCFAQNEVPTVSEFCERFSRINATSDLSDWLALDAGGFTLDVYGQIGGKEHGTSYETGGDDITSSVRECLAREKQLPLEQVAYSDAETSKRRACENRTKATKSPVARVCRDQTRQIYTTAIREVFAWASQAIGRQHGGIPLILTGGAMHNDFLRELVEMEMERCDQLDCVLVTSIEISQVVRNDEIVVGGGVGLRRFYEATRGFNPNMKFDISRDVVAGLVESFAKGVSS